MLNRVLVPFLLCVAAAAQTAPAPAPVAPTNDVTFYKTFGSDGTPGSFRTKFSRNGAGLVFVQAIDHYVSLDAKKKAEHGPDDWLLLTVNGRDHALRLTGDLGAAFPIDIGTAPWTATDIDGGVTFTIDSGTGLVLEKTLRHDPAGRGFLLEIALQNRSSQATGALALELRGPTLSVPAESSLFGNLATSIAAPLQGAPEFVKPKPGAPAHELKVDPKSLSFAGGANRFFGAFLWPQDDAARAVLTKFEADSLPPLDDEDSHTKAGTATRVRYGMALAIPPVGGETRAKFGLYLGPKSFRVYATLSQPERFAPILDVDLEPPCCPGVSVPGGQRIAKVLLHLLGWFHDLVGNWGVAIIMLTILVRGLLAPVNFHMQKSMRAYGARMAVVKPKIDALQKKYADDKAALQQAMAELQREHKLLPPLGGCLPIFLTTPVYIGLFTALRTAYELRQQPFVAWIDDLSRSDHLFALPFWPHAFNLLPLLWITLMCIQVFRQPLPTDPQQRQTATIMRYMPLLFGVMLYNYASALLVYMVTSMAWTFVESALIKKKLGPIDPNAAAMVPTPM